MDLYWNWQLDVYPELATWYGEPGDHGRWTDNTPEAMEQRRGFERKLLAAAGRVEAAALSPVRQLEGELFLDDLRLTVEGFDYPDELMPLNQMGGVQQDVPDLLAMMPVRNGEDYEFILRRLAGAPKLVEETLHWLEQGLAKGVTPPKVTLRDVPSQIQNLLTEDPFDSALLDPFRSRPEAIDAAAWDAVRKQAAALYRERIAPAYRGLRDYLVGTYLPAARETIGLGALPDGAAWYAYRARRYTTTDLTPEQIHALGRSEVRRIRAEMERISRETGYKGSFEEFTQFLRTDPRFFHATAEDLIREYRDIAKRADAELPKLFGTLPRTPYGVIPIPDYAAQSQTTAYYRPGTLKGGRAGYFFANTYALDTRPRWEMEALTVHEAVPGHHLQISIAQELEDVHPLRRHSGYTAFVEGWGLYSESLGEEMGFYRDPYSKFGQLTYEMWRAIRLVVDTGMHAMGWSRDQAIEFFKANSAKTEHDIVVEIDRYIVWPGQALAYKIGELKLKELRAYARARLGENFDIRRFHDRVLEAGAVPLNVLERRIKAWVAESAD
ncbi:MAG: DUF885 domain-containing protein [Gammaproteobacteria bacterium]|nr:DUF885 domain-containing protein [Gammaproteobacteria bacterium]